MPVVWRLARIMAKYEISLKQLADRVGITQVNLSRIKTGKSTAARFSTLGALCEALDCQPGDLLEYIPDASFNK